MDTAANSTLLNIKSFPNGYSKEEAIGTWQGTNSVIGREVWLDDLVIGEHHLTNMRFSSVDLTAMQQACGKRVDGVLGADLMERLGLSIDLRNHVGRFALPTSAEQAQFDKLDRHMKSCEQAFNRSDEKAFAECLDPAVELVSFTGDYRGRESVLKYFEKAYFQQKESASLTITPRAHHLLGNVIWLEYEMRITLQQQSFQARGNAVFRNAGDKWLLLNMNESLLRDR